MRLISSNLLVVANSSSKRVARTSILQSGRPTTLSSTLGRKDDYFASSSSLFIRRGVAHFNGVGDSTPTCDYRGLRTTNNTIMATVTDISRQNFSTESSSQGGIRGWMENRKTKKEQEQYMEQMERLSEMEELTLKNYKGELQRGLDSWGAKLSFGQTKEIQLAKEVVECIGCFIEVLGETAKVDDLINMDRLQRLKVATSSNKSVEDIQIMISQVQNMDLMQRTLRKRRLEGKPIPPDAQSMQAAIKKDALAVMTKTQKEMMKKRQLDLGRRMARKRR